MPDVRTERERTDRLWERVRPLLPPPAPHPEGGRPFADDRACFEGIVHVLRNGSRWRARDALPACPSGVTCWRRHRDGTRAGVGTRVWRIVPDELADAGRRDTSELALDTSFVEAKTGARGREMPVREGHEARVRDGPGTRHPGRRGDGRGDSVGRRARPGRPCGRPGDTGLSPGDAGPGRPRVRRGPAAGVPTHDNISEPNLAPIGSDLSVPHATIVRDVRALGYEGWHSVEMREPPRPGNPYFHSA